MLLIWTKSNTKSGPLEPARFASVFRLSKPIVIVCLDIDNKKYQRLDYAFKTCHVKLASHSAY